VRGGCSNLVVVSRDLNEFIEASVPISDPWTSVLHVNGGKVSIKAPASLSAVLEVS
jgi:hypothetical protein